MIEKITSCKSGPGFITKCCLLVDDVERQEGIHVFLVKRKEKKQTFFNANLFQT